MYRTRKSIFETYPKTTLTLVVLVIILLVDGIVGRLLIPANDHDFRAAHPYYHHGLLPSRSQTTHWGPIEYLMVTNSLGFRDAELKEVSLASEKYRILLMGDSHTEAVGVPFEESFTGQLLTELDTSRIELLNAATVSYSPKLYYYKAKYLLEEAGLDFDEMYVFMDISDIQNEYAYQEFESSTSPIASLLPKLKSTLKDHSFIYYATHRLYLEHQREKFYRNISQRLIDRNNTIDLYRTFFSHFHNDVLLNNPQFHTTISEWYSDESLYQRWGKQGIEFMTIYMQQLVELCQQHQIPLTITVHPWRTQVKKSETEDRHTRYWRNFAQKNDIGFINLYPVFINELPAEEVIQSHFIEDDNHWTASGHELVADKVSSFLLSSVAKNGLVNISEEDLYYHRGIVFWEQENFDSALLSLSRAIEINSNCPEFYYQRGKVHLQRHMFRPASSDFQQVLELAPNHHQAQLNIQHLPSHQTVYQTTLLLDQQPSDSSYIERGKAWLKLGNYLRAYDDFDQAREKNVRNPKAYYYLGYIKKNPMQSERESIRYFNRAIALDSNYLDAYRQRAEAFLATGATERAAEDQKKVEQLSQ
ncbi:MAG: tetratricopeptide repeat protein [Bacteroidota bacterium]